MYEPLQLNQSEWAVVVELLERERNDLPTEIHHTRTSSLREELRLRLQLIDSILDRARPLVEPVESEPVRAE